MLGISKGTFRNKKGETMFFVSPLQHFLANAGYLRIWRWTLYQASTSVRRKRLFLLPIVK